MQCGICRIPFKSEYFGNNIELIQIFEKKIREHRRSLNMNNEMINVRISQSNRNINQSNNINNSRYYYRPNERDIQLQNFSINNDSTFIFLFHPNKFICIVTLFANILISGFGTLIIGVKNLDLYDFFLSIMQFCFCYSSISKGIKIKKNKKLNEVNINSFLWIYLFFIASIFYLSSIYAGIFHNFVFFNPRIFKNKEKGICIIVLNCIIGGIGTIFYGIIAQGISCCRRIKIWIIGITQVFGFMIFIFSICIFSSINLAVFFILLFIGFLAYLSSIFVGFKFYKNLST